MVETINKHIRSHEVSQDGSFKRQKSHFDTPFGNEVGQLPIEANRYRIIYAAICPWCSRLMIIRDLLGLENIISAGEVYTINTPEGWLFKNDPYEKDPVLNIHGVKEIYLSSEPDYQGRYTVPFIADVKEDKIVNNDFHHLPGYLIRQFKDFHKKGAPDLIPENLDSEILEFNEWLFDKINNGVYKCGFATSQEAYENAYDELFEALDQLEKRLSQQRYLFGKTITESDVRLYATLVRFDVFYYPFFRCNRNMIIDFPNLWNYCKDLYAIPEFKRYTDFDGIKKGYQLGGAISNPNKILAKGPDLSVWNEPHNRAKFNK